MSNNIENLVSNTITNLKQVIDVNNIVGEPKTFGSTTIIPIAKVTFGFLSGGGEYSPDKPTPHHAGGSGGGININPIGFLVVDAGKLSMIKIDKEAGDTKWSDLIETAKNLLKKH